MQKDHQSNALKLVYFSLQYDRPELPSQTSFFSFTCSKPLGNAVFNKGSILAKGSQQACNYS
jgi:hypothetical protein